MKNMLKILLGFLVSLVYIPICIGVTYGVISKLTNIFNPGYESVLLNVVFGILGLITLLLLVVLLEKIIEKLITRKIRFMVFCTAIPIIIFCIGIVAVNFNFFSIQKEISEIGINLLGDTELLNAALLSLSSLFVALSFIYLIVFVMYIIVYELSIFIKNKKINSNS